MSNIKKLPVKTKTHSESQAPNKPNGKVVNIDKKINHAIQQRLSGFVKEIQQLKSKQKKLEAYQKACAKLGGPQVKKKKKGKKSANKKPKK